MIKHLVRHAFCACTVFLCLIDPAQAQLVSILDQGHNVDLNYRARSKFVVQHCVSNPDRFVEAAGPPPQGFSVVLTTFNASLCPNGTPQMFFNGAAATHPRTFFEPITGTNFTTTNNLDHSRIMSDAIWGISRNVFQQHFQVFGMTGNRRSTVRPLTDIVDDELSYTTSRGKNIERALRVLASNGDPSLGAVVIATVVGNRQTPPDECRFRVGQSAVDALFRKGIPVIAGLANNDIPAGATTWPNCLNGVINVGRTDGFGGSFTGIGIGSNGIDYYTESAVPYNGFSETGNSFAAPKVAAMFALLHKAHPNATIDQKRRALERANTSTYNHRGVRRTRLSRSRINRAISDLATIIAEDTDINNNPIDDVNFDPVQYGSAFGGLSSDVVQLDIDFSAAASSGSSSKIAVKQVAAVQAKSRFFQERRDIVLEFTGLFNESLSSNRRFRIRINDNIVDTVDGFVDGEETTLKIVIDRNRFSSNPNTTNTVKIEPIKSDSSWGVKNIRASFNPTIELQLGTVDTNVYGYLQEPNRFTGARFSVNITNSSVDHKLKMTGWDIDIPTETRVFVNGYLIGNLNVSNSSSFGQPSVFTVPSSRLNSGENSIELQQNNPGVSWFGFEDRKWAVKDISIDIFRPDLVAQDIVLAKKNIRAGEPFEAIALIKNQGDSASSSTGAFFYVSQDSVINFNDTIIGNFPTGSIGVNQAINLNAAGLSTQQINTGYYLGFCINAATNETVTNNNCSLGLSLKSVPSIAPVIMLLMDEETTP